MNRIILGILAAVIISVSGVFSYLGLNQVLATNLDTTEILENTEIAEVIEEEITTKVKIKDEDKLSTWTKETSTVIKLNDNNISVTGEGAETSANTVTIKSAGTYVLEGTLTNGQIIVDAGDTDLVRLVLNGVSITSNINSPIYCKTADKLVVTLAENSKNYLTDSVNYTYFDTEKEEPNGALFSKCDLTINGVGELNVKGQFNNGIETKDDLLILSGNITVDSKNDALRGKDSVTILDGTINLTSLGDSIKTNNDTDETKGFIEIYGGEININSLNDGIQADNVLNIYDGKFNITTAKSDEDTVSDSFKGMKSSSDILIEKGEFIIDSLDDSIHSNTNITINGGNLTLKTEDDGIHADNTIEINDGNIKILNSYEGIEASIIIINGGDVDILASDDGINASDGSGSEFSGMGRPGGFGNMEMPEGGRQAPPEGERQVPPEGFEPPAKPNEENLAYNATNVSQNNNIYLEINGGNIKINAGADGIDSNGNVTMNAGYVFVNGPENTGNGALDYDGSFTINGGTLIAAGTSGMAMNVSNTSTQASTLVYFTTTQEAGKKIELLSSDGTSILSFTPDKKVQSVVISTPELIKDKTYKLVSEGGLNFSFTQSDGVINISDTGEIVTRNQSMGGMGRRQR